jgi:hypothetical protein
MLPETNTVVFQDGQRAEFDVVLLCTGFEPILEHYASFPDESIAARIQGRRASLRILNPVVSFFLVGIEPIQIQISRRTILINALATPWLLTSTL